MKKVEPKDLIVGQEYYVKMRLIQKDKGDLPYCFKDEAGFSNWFPHNQPIYTTSETEPVATLEVREDNEHLKMVVEVATGLYLSNSFDSCDDCAREAIDLINACKRVVKEGEI